LFVEAGVEILCGLCRVLRDFAFLFGVGGGVVGFGAEDIVEFVVGGVGEAVVAEGVE
jgi:hypothetical protein